MTRVVIIGYGNPLRGDDAVGYLAAERLASIINDSGVEIRAVHQLTPELAEVISESDRVVFLDAAIAGESGTIQKRLIVPALDCDAWTHSSTPEGLLGMSSALFGTAPAATLCSIRAESFELSEKLSPIVANALDLLVAAVSTELASG
jgi:hydrogenase maturation protease